MRKSLLALLPVILLVGLPAGCATGSTLAHEASSGATTLWTEGHHALHQQRFARAEEAFGRLIEAYPASPEAREAEFFLGSLRMDPRNPDWSPGSAVYTLESYLNGERDGDRLNRRQEAAVLLALAHRISLPTQAGEAGSRTIPVRPVPAANESEEPPIISEEMERLRRQLAERDVIIEELRSEMDRIRRTLVPDEDP